MSGLDLPAQSVREQIGHAIDIIIQQKRFADGSRRITSITEVTGLSKDGHIETSEIFGYRKLSDTANPGQFYATGRLPTFIGDFVALGLIQSGESFL